MARIDSAYEYYVANYGQSTVSRYDSHKKSDLRKVYNRIVKTNKESPLYKIHSVDSAKRYAIDIKEGAKDLQNTIASLSEDYGSFASSFQKKVAYSSDDNTVSVKYVGDGSEDNNSEKFDINIRSLAMPQVNTGQFLNDYAQSFVPGIYSFDLDTVNSSYEFQFNINKDESNKDVLSKIANLVNSSSLGISAELISNDKGSSALQLTSHQTGLSEQEEFLFKVSPSDGLGSAAAMDILRIDRVTQPASNSDFTLNGAEHSSLSNSFTINNAFELSLKKTSEEGIPTTIGFKANVDAIAHNIQTLLNSYNNIVSVANTYSGSEASAGNKLNNDIRSLVSNKVASLEYIGLIANEDGQLTIDKDILADALRPERTEDTLNTLNSFRDQLKEKADAIAIDPMSYVNKVVVAYKNPGHNFNTPYISSIYSGLMLDSYT